MNGFCPSCGAGGESAPMPTKQFSVTTLYLHYRFSCGTRAISDGKRAKVWIYSSTCYLDGVNQMRMKLMKRKAA